MSQGIYDTVGELIGGQTPPQRLPCLGEGLPDSPFQLKKFFLFPPKSRGGLGRGGKGVGG